MLHESGHFFQHRLYNGTFPNVTNCNPHYIEKASSATCAWTEGFADAVAAYLLGDERYVWPDGSSYPFTAAAGWQTGDHVQGNVGGSLLQLWNQVDGSWDRSITTLASHTPATFADWFKNVRPTAVPPLSTTGTALTALDTHAINYGPTVVGDNAYHALSNGGGVALQRGGTCNVQHPVGGRVRRPGHLPGLAALEVHLQQRRHRADLRQLPSPALPDRTDHRRRPDRPCRPSTSVPPTSAGR